MKAQRNCPICGNKNIEELTKFDYSSQTCVNLPDKAAIVCCEECGFIYNDLKSTQKEFNEYYNTGSAYSLDYSIAGETQGERAQDYIVVLDMIQPYINYESKILEIGCAKGGLCRFLMDKGYKHVQAIEPSIECVKLAKNSGIDCIHGDSFIDNPSFYNKFDLIILSEVAEHIFDFKESMLNIRNMLKPNGLLFVETPDVNNYCNTKRDFTPYFFFNYEHINHFSKEAFLNVSKLYNFEMIECQEFMSGICYPSLAALLKKLPNDSEQNYQKYKKPKERLKKYLNICEEKIQNENIKSLRKTNEELILWGIGSTTTLLLNKMFKNCNVVQLIDISKSKQNKTLIINNKILKIYAPEDINNKDATIIIMPKLYQDEILNQIKTLSYSNKVIML